MRGRMTLKKRKAIFKTIRRARAKAGQHRRAAVSVRRVLAVLESVGVR